MTGEEEICVLSVAAVMDPGYPVAISTHVAPNSSTKQQPVTELCLERAVGLKQHILAEEIKDWFQTWEDREMSV